MTCDHAPARASILVFRESTMFVGFQELGDGETALIGNCRRCKSTIAIPIDVARGHVVSGEIGAQPTTPIESPQFANQCPVNAWCCDEPGHTGDCVLSF